MQFKVYEVSIIAMFEFLWLLIFLMVYSTYSYRLQCPDISQRQLRASGYCTRRLKSKYTCLYDTNSLSFSEQCNRNPDFVTPGEKYVISGNLRNVDCSSELYQPFRLWSNVSGECLYQKTFCKGEGQVIFNNGSLIEERTCRCDYMKGYKFIKQPKLNCSCSPTEEDCSCYIHRCPEGSVLSPDYECVNEKHHVDSKCPTIDIESGSSQTAIIKRTTDKREQLSIRFIAVSAMFVLILAYTVIVFVCWDKIRTFPKMKALWCNIQGNAAASSKGEDKHTMQRTESFNDKSTEKIISDVSTDQALNKKIIDMETLLNQNEILRSKLDILKKQLDQAGKEKDDERKKMNDLEIKARNDETERRKLHNEIMGLKGNIRVFCRVRPLPRDKNVKHDVGNHIIFSDQGQKKIELVKNGEKNEKFIFDKVFRDNATQHEVFEEISQLVQSALDGYNVCIFAYGQTGSGKTYTMEGTSDHGADDRGIVPRAVEQIFEVTRKLQGIEWTYNFYASFLEIYNEKIRDLLRDDRKASNHARTNQNEVCINKIPSVEVKTEEEIHQLLQKAFKNRAVEETNCNKTASRSHSVFTLKLTGINSKTEQRCNGTLNLIDLAGNESLKKSMAEGQRQKETAAINKSLCQLGIVIRAIKKNENHIPFKDSTLTTLLQNSLERDSKTLMFVNVSAAEECSQETLNSLRFARDVNKCNLKKQKPK